jgi:hypothetical protein
MVTVHTYWSPVEAGLAKSLLDDYEIFCVLADEDTNRYAGAPFAVPIRLRGAKLRPIRRVEFSAEI